MIWILFWFVDSLLYSTAFLKGRRSCRKLQGFLFISCSVSSPLLLPFLYTIYLSLFISSYFLFHPSPLWIIVVLTCFVQITETYFLWCLPAVCLSLAHPSSVKAPVFLLSTAGSSRVRYKHEKVPILIQSFPGSPEQHAALPPLYPLLPCCLLALPAWFRRSWEGSEWPGVQVGAILRIFIISFKSPLCSGEWRGLWYLTEVEG